MWWCKRCKTENDEYIPACPKCGTPRIKVGWFHRLCLWTPLLFSALLTSVVLTLGVVPSELKEQLLMWSFYAAFFGKPLGFLLYYFSSSKHILSDLFFVGVVLIGMALDVFLLTLAFSSGA
jgi:hypothetical protein